MNQTGKAINRYMSKVHRLVRNLGNGAFKTSDVFVYLLCFLWIGSPGTTRADAIADFYRGKTVRVIVGYGAGGGYDIYGRIFAEFIGKHIPGNPTVIVQNMPGGGSYVAAKYLYSAATRDGTYFGSIAQTLALDAAMNNDTAQFDVTKFNYVGRLLDNVDIGYGRPGAKFKTFDDARRQEIVVASTGGASTALLVPAALQKFGGARFKIVSGYGGSAEMYLAAERGEVELMGGVGLTFAMQRNPEWFAQKTAPVLYQISLKRHPQLPDVPPISELGLSTEGTAVLRIIAASSEIGRSIITTPGVPPERLAALRASFQEMLQDKDFLDAVNARDIPIFGAKGEYLDDVTREVMQTPTQTLELTKALLKN